MTRYLALFILLLSACSPRENGSISPVDVQRVQVQGDASFGVVEYAARPIKSLVISNNESSTLNLTPVISGTNSDKFAFVMLGCESVAPGKKCLIKVVFNGASEQGSYSASLAVGNQTISLSAQINQVPQTVYNVVVNNQLVSGTKDLGPLVGNSLSLLSIKIVNNSPKPGNKSTLTVDNPQIQLLSNGCTNVSLKPSQSCFVKAVLTGNNTDALVSINLNFDNSISSLSAQGVVENKQSNLAAMSSSVSLGDFYEEGISKIQLIKVQNTGDGVGTLSDFILPPEYTLVYNGCNNVKPGKTCVIRLLYKSPDQVVGSHSSEATIGNSTVSLETNRVTDPNKLGSLILTVAPNILVENCSAVGIAVKDSGSLDYVSSAPMSLSSNQVLYSDSSCSLVSDLIIPSFESEKNMFIKSDSAGIKNLQISFQNKIVQKDILFYAPLQVSPALSGLHQGSSLQIAVTGGKLPYTYEVIEGVGEVSGSGLYLATSAGSAVVRVTDSLALTGESEFLVCLPGYSPTEDNLNCTPDHLYITDSCSMVDYDGTCQLTANGGVAPYSWSTNGGDISQSGLFTATCSGEVNNQITLTDSIGQTAVVNMTQGCWPFGNDGAVNLAAGNYQLQKTAANTLQIVNTANSSVVKSSFGTYKNSAGIQETCQADFSSLTLASGATLSVAEDCKWLVLGVKNNVSINGQLKANNLTTVGSFNSKTPDSMGNLSGPNLSLALIQKNGASGQNGFASSSGALGGNGGAAFCGNGGGGGGGAGINNAKRFPYAYTGGNQVFTVPARVTKVKYKLWGAGGAGDLAVGSYNDGSGGGGGYITGIINSNPNAVWNIVVGQGGAVNSAVSAYGAAGGGIGALSTGADLAGYRSNGGGLTGIFSGAGSFDQSSFLAIAGAGGGACARDGWSGGGGGNPGGHANQYNRGYGATQFGPGDREGISGTAARGSPGSGMAGGAGGVGHNGGGGGGAGYFGGGGGNGGSGVAGGAGGGGASFCNASFATCSYLNGTHVTPGGTGDTEYANFGTPGRGGTGAGAGNATGKNGAAVLYVEGDTGEAGTVATCGAAGTGGLGSVNYGGDGGIGGTKGTHGQGLFIKVRGNVSGTGSITTSGTSGSNGVLGTVGGGSYGNGGQGGGGAGGSGGQLHLYSRGSVDASLSLSVGGGAAGNNAQSGDNGQLVNQSF